LFFFFWGPSPLATHQADEKVKTMVKSSWMTTSEDWNWIFNSARLASIAFWPNKYNWLWSFLRRVSSVGKVRWLLFARHK
jgi:hypothetical protein